MNYRITKYFQYEYEAFYGENEVVKRGLIFREVSRYKEWIHLTRDMNKRTTIGFSMRIDQLHLLKEV